MTKTAAQRQREYRLRLKADTLSVQVTVPTIVREILVEHGCLAWDMDRDKSSVGAAVQSIVDFIECAGTMPDPLKKSSQ